MPNKLKGRGKVAVSVEGLREVDKKLDSIEGDLLVGLGTLATVTGKQARDSAKDLTPELTGRAKASLKYKVFKNVIGTVSFVVRASRPPGFHFHFLEFGTVNQDPTPILRPTYEKYKPLFVAGAIAIIKQLKSR